MNCYPFWAGDFQHLMLKYMVMFVYGPVFLQPRQIPTPTYLLPPFAGTLFHRKCRNTCNSICGSCVYVDIDFIFTYTQIRFIFALHILAAKVHKAVFIYIYIVFLCVCVYHKVCYLLVVFLRCPHSNPESSSQHVGQADGLKIIFPIVPLQIPFVLVLKGISHGKIS